MNTNFNHHQKKNIQISHALFGGTFDPIHYGHLLPIENLAKKMNLKKITLIPNHIPPHRNKIYATTKQKISMLKLAIKNNPLFSIDKREIQHSTPSYTVKTLLSYRKNMHLAQPLIFIIGADTLLSINKWHKWEQILNLCHLLVLPRPNYRIKFVDQNIQKWIHQHKTFNFKKLHTKSYGLIHFANTPLINISSTKIRERKNQKKSYKNMLPKQVFYYINKHNLY